MAYSKTTWEDLPSTNTPITASNLNKIENQVYANTNDIATNTTNIATNASDIDNLETTTNNLVARTTDTIIFRTVKLEESIPLNAFASVYKGTTIPSITGYTPLICYEVLGSGDAGVKGYTNLPNNGNVGCWIKNFGNTTTTISGVDFKVMYIKNSL